jgi:hypothetical protein
LALAHFTGFVALTGGIRHFIGPPELFDFLLEVLQLLALVGGQPRPKSIVDLGPADPHPKRLGRHPELGADRREGGPLGGVFISMLGDHPDGAFTHLR